MPEPQESTENKYLGHRMLFNSKINAVIEESFNNQKYMKNNDYETNGLSARSMAIKYMSCTIAETEKGKIPHIMKFELDLYVISLKAYRPLF